MRSTRATALVLLLVLGTACSDAVKDPNPVPDPEPDVGEDQNLQPRDGEEALEWLLAGNHRFWDGHPRNDHESMRRVAMLDEGQNPFAIVLGCADSRVTPELVFDHGLGDMFVIRVAGNVVDDNEAGSIEYAVLHLHVRLVVVLGHESCGAVTAAMHAVDSEPAELKNLIGRIQPALEGIPAGLPLEEQVHLGVEANVRQSVRQLRETIEHADPQATENTLIVGAIYETKTGKIRVLDR